jgi:hypothetical protein
LAYAPNRGGSFTVRGSGHTHCAPDHSGIDVGTQERRLRDLPTGHQHDFVWMTAHGFVAPNPNVGGIVHMFGIEVYTATLPTSKVAPHMLGYLPDGSLASSTTFPFGAFDLDLSATAAAIRQRGGLPSLAHPSRLPPTEAEMDAVDERLWGMEVMSGTSDTEANLVMIDHRLGTGRYVCLTSGGDIHAEDDRMTRGYEVVSVETNPPDPGALFAAVSTCNMFACDTHDTTVTPIGPPSVRIVDGAVEMSLPRVVQSIRFVGRGGAVLAQYANVQSARYSPKLEDLYVRTEVYDQSNRAVCFAQPIWLVDETTLSSGP